MCGRITARIELRTPRTHGLFFCVQMYPARDGIGRESICQRLRDCVRIRTAQPARHFTVIPHLRDNRRGCAAGTAGRKGVFIYGRWLADM